MPPVLSAADSSAPVHLAISESVVGDVNLNDARAAMLVWIKRLTEDLNVVIDTKLFTSTQEIVERTRKGQLDAVAVKAEPVPETVTGCDAGAASPAR